MSGPSGGGGAGPWVAYAARWDLLGPPLRPSPEDVAVVEAIAREPHVTPLRVLLLGVTPELATAAWPAGTSLVAVDRSEAMIGGVWPRAGTPVGARAILGDWSALPIDDGSVDLVLGDAVFNTQEYPRGAEALFAEVRRVLGENGRFVVRAFVPPQSREGLSAIARDLTSGRVGSLDALKLRLWTSLQASVERGVRLGDVWDAWRAICPDPEALAARVGWRAETLATIRVYRDSDTRYTIPSVDELHAVAQRTSFDQVSVHTKRYELGERCPTVVYRSRPPHPAGSWTPPGALR